jgi:hypothetical protein
MVRVMVEFEFGFGFGVGFGLSFLRAKLSLMNYQQIVLLHSTFPAILVANTEVAVESQLLRNLILVLSEESYSHHASG